MECDVLPKRLVTRASVAAIFCNRAHGIAREQLEREGLPIAEVINALNAVAYGGTVLSDAPRHDNK